MEKLPAAGTATTTNNDPDADADAIALCVSSRIKGSLGGEEEDDGC
jgi:hypothetical protein